MGKTFWLEADVCFEAEDLEDAFRVLSKHFQNLIEGRATHLSRGGTLHVYQVPDEDDPGEEEVMI